jgi:ADP-ribose pyrophosphatase
MDAKLAGAGQSRACTNAAHQGANSMSVPPSPWRTRSSRTIYQNPWLRLREDLVELPSGRTTVYGVVSTGECVGVLPFLDPDTVVLVRQYRYVAGRYTWEMPTGGVAPGEPIQDAAQRELAEESGYRAGRLEPVCSYHTSKSVMDETAHLFLGFDLGEIVDSMTIIAVLQAELRRPGRGRRR